ncbi:MAG: ComF family protein [Gammaproteobacteria bacterium]|nr:ComF family protein [Gammaproteobacteria bacterium]
MVNIWPNIAHWFGSACRLCNAPADGVCQACLAELPRNRNACVRCALPLGTTSTSLCGECLRHPPTFDRAVAPLLYVAPVDDLIAGFKYHHRLADGRFLADLLAGELARREPFPQLLLPMPSSARRLRERGFNQAAELTRRLARQLGIEWSTAALRRGDGARPQRGLGRAARLRNLQGAFAAAAGLPSHIALVDDVITTGATVEAASRALREAGVQQIEVWAIARTPRARRTTAP